MSLEAWCAGQGQPYYRLTERVDGRYVKSAIRAEEARRIEMTKIDRPAGFAGRVRDADLLPPHGFLRGQNGVVVYRGLGTRDTELAADLGRFLESADRVSMVSAEPASTSIDDECVYIGGHANFGHFINQGLMRLSMIERIPDCSVLPIAVYDNLPGRFLDFLDLLGYPAERRISIPADRITRFRRAWLLSSPSYRGIGNEYFISPESVWALKAAAARLVAPSRIRRRIFVARADAMWRRLVNSGDVATVHDRQGFESVDFARIPALQQIETAMSAEILVSTLGAGSAISIFTQPDCAQIELLPPEFSGFFGTAGFALMTGQPLARIVGRVASVAEIEAAGLVANPGAIPRDQDFVADCRDLDSVLSAAVNHCARRRAD